MPAHRGEKIFISYSHKDKTYLEDIKKILKPGIRDQNIFAWDDTNIEPGDNWREEIDKGLSSATVALLLVSKDYLASDFIEKKEFLPIVDKVKKGELRVFWLLLNPCLWKKTKIEEFQALHEADKPLSKLAPDKREEELVGICERIMAAMPRPPSIIKGWPPYTYEDKEIFANLERESFVKECVSGICHEAFRFGLLYGESGVGKTSVLQAAIRPRLEAEGYDCGYIDFRNEPPLDSIRRSFRTHNFLSETEMRDCSFISLLQKLAQQRGKPLVLLLDQFEQVLFQPHPGPEGDFSQALQSWYHDTSLPLIKILVSVERKFSDEMLLLLADMKCKMHPQQNFLLPKLKNNEAEKVVRIMAEREELRFEPGFIELLTEGSSSKEEKMVSPVHLQIVANRIKHSSSDEEREFTARALNRMGGLKGTYGSVLEEELKNHPESQDIATQVLKALIDWSKGTQARARTREELKIKMEAGQTDGTTQRTVEIRDLSAQKLDHTLGWLCSCRFITRGKRLGVDTYELAQDWLSPVMKLLAEDIAQVREANALLTQRSNVWKGNDRDPRYLLSRKELWLIKQHRPYLEWDSDKRDLFQESSNQMRRRMAGLVTVVVGIALAFATLVVLYNPQYFSPLKYTKTELLKVYPQIRNNPETLSEIAKALFFAKGFDQAETVISNMEEEWDKDVARSEIATSVLSTDPPFYEQAYTLANAIQDARERTVAKCILKEIAHEKDDACGYPGYGRHFINPGELMASAERYVEQESDPIKKLDILAAIVQAATRSVEASSTSPSREKIQAVLNEMQQQLQIIETRYTGPDERFRAFQGRRSAAEIAAYLGHANEANKILGDAQQAADAIPVMHERTLVMRSIAIAAAQFALLMVQDCPKSICNLKAVDKWLELAEEAKKAITEDAEKYAVLRSIVEAKVGVAHSSKVRKYLDQARDTAKEIHGKAHRSSALRLIVTELVNFDAIREANETAEQNETDVKGDLLANILLSDTRKSYPLKIKEYRPLRLPQNAIDEMMEIPAAPFSMGSMEGERSERPEHTVYVGRFLLDSSETTVKMYDEFLRQTKRRQKPGYWDWKGEIPLGDQEKPVIGVTWREAKSYCRWRQKRLPTEAEWEKAARGTDKRKYPWGNSNEDGNKRANYDKQDPKGAPYSVLTNVGSYSDAGGDSPYGIHDMAGNAWEWVEDWHDGSVYMDIHSSGYPASSIGDEKILRGGSWDNHNKDDRLRSTFRLRRDPKDSYGTYGFRCAQSVDTPFNETSQLPPQR